MSRYISPQYWMSFPIISGEISNIKTFHCPSNPKITDDNVNIIKQVRRNGHDKKIVFEHFFVKRLAVACPMVGRLCSISP